MNNQSGALSFEALIGNTQFRSSIATMESDIKRLTGTIGAESQKIDSTFATLGKIAGGYFAFTELAQLPGKIVQVRGEFQQLEIAFTTMLKSKSKADQLMAEVVQLAATTPFGLRDASAATKQLLAYGSASNEVIGELRMLGDVAAGVGAPIGDLAYLYGTLRTQGRAMTVDIRQFAGRGIPIYEELAKVLKINTDQVSAFVEAGKVGFKDVQQAFKNMSGEGGTFANLMAQQSKSLTGLTSQFSDALDVMFNDIGKSNEGLAATVITSATSVVEGYQTVIDVLTVLTATYGAYKAAIITVNAIKAAEATSNALISASIDKQSGGYAREIALKVKSAQASAQRSAAIAEEAIVEATKARATLYSLRSEVSLAAAKKASAIESAKSAASEIVSAQARLAAAQANQAATARNLSASVRSAAAKEVESAQNALLIASESGVVARKNASAASSDFLARKTLLETAAKEASLVTNRAKVATETANVAASNASAIASTRLTAVQSLQIAVTRQLAAAQAAFNASLLSNPIVLATTSLVALAGAVWYLSDGTTAAEVAQKSYTKAIEEDKKAKEELIAKTSELTTVLNNNASTNFQQVQAYNSLQQLYPKVLGNLSLLQFKLLDATQAQRLLNQAIDDMGIQSQSKKYDDAQKKVEELTNKLQILQRQQGQSGIGAGGLTVPIEDTRKALEAAKIEAKKLGEQVQQNEKDSWIANAPIQEQVKHYESIKDGLVKQRKELEANITQLQKAGVAANSLQLFFANMSLSGVVQQLDQVSSKLESLTDKPTVLFGGNKAYWDNQKKVATEKLESLGVSSKGSKEWKDLAKQIEEADKKLEAYSLKQKKLAEKDKIQPFGSIAYWEQVSRKAQEIIDKTPSSNTAVLSQQTQVKSNAEKQAEDIRKQYAIKSFEDELNEKRAQYELYQRWVAAYGQKAADDQFATLVAGNQSYLDYLNGEIRKLESTAGYTKLNEPDSKKLDFLNSEKNTILGKSTALESFNLKLQETEESAGSLTEAIQELRRIQSELAEPKTGDDYKQREAVARRILELEKERKNQLKSFLLEVADSQQKRLEIEKYYNGLLIELDKQHNDKTTDEYIKGRQDIQKAREKEQRDQKVAALEESQAYKELEAVIMATGVKAIEDKINRTRRAMVATQQSLGVESEEYKRLAKSIQDLELDLDREKVKNFQMIGQLAADLGSALEGANGSLGQMGSLLVGAASQANNLSVAFSKSSTSAEKTASAVQGAITLLNIVISSAQQRKQAEEEYYRSVINQQQEYNLLLNEQIGLMGDASGSVFYTDFQNKIDSSLAMMKGAIQGYEDSLDALENGRAKNGQKNGIDWKKVGQGAAAGAGIGAVAGGGVFSWLTTAIGAVAGGLVGLFGGLKKKDTFTPLLEAWPQLIDESQAGLNKFNVELAQTLINNNLVDETTKAALQTTIEWVDQLKKAQEAVKAVIQELAGALGDNLRDGLVNAFKEGQSAAESFGNSVSKILENILEQMIFSKVLGPALDQLEKEMNASIDGGDGSWIDDFGRFFAQADKLGNAYFDGLEQAQKEAGQFGFDLWKKEMQNSGSAPAQVGFSANLTEDTGTLLNGQMNALRITSVDHLNVARSMLFELTAIRLNTGNTSNAAQELYAIRVSLDSIDRVLKSDWLRALGGG